MKNLIILVVGSVLLVLATLHYGGVDLRTPNVKMKMVRYELNHAAKLLEDIEHEKRREHRVDRAIEVLRREDSND